MASRGRAENRPRSPEQRPPSVAERIGNALTSSFRSSGSAPRAASEGVGRAQLQHGNATGGSYGAPGVYTAQEVAQRFGPLTFCHSCGDPLASQLAVQCRGCGELNHTSCFNDYEVAENYTANMCCHCGGRLMAAISTIESVMERTSLKWETDKWWLHLVDLVRHDYFHEYAGNSTRHELEIF